MPGPEVGAVDGAGVAAGVGVGMGVGVGERAGCSLAPGLSEGGAVVWPPSPPSGDVTGISVPGVGLGVGVAAGVGVGLGVTVWLIPPELLGLEPELPELEMLVTSFSSLSRMSSR